jgi:hypothetical protein
VEREEGRATTFMNPHDHPEAPLGGDAMEEEAGEGAAAAAARVCRLASPAQDDARRSSFLRTCFGE